MNLVALLDLILCLVLAGVLGVVSQKILGYKLGGLIVSVFIGFVGAYLGKEAAIWFNLPYIVSLRVNGRQFPILWSLAGAMIATLVMGMIARKSRVPRKKS